MTETEQKIAKLRQEIQDLQEDTDLHPQERREQMNDALAEIKELERGEKHV